MRLLGSGHAAARLGSAGQATTHFGDVCCEAVGQLGDGQTCREVAGEAAERCRSWRTIYGRGVGDGVARLLLELLDCLRLRHHSHSTFAFDCVCDGDCDVHREGSVRVELVRAEFSARRSMKIRSWSAPKDDAVLWEPVETFSHRVTM